jgi:hypothetical protein
MNRRLRLVFLLAVLLYLGVWIASQVRSVRDRFKVAQLTNGMKTICVGRYLVDVPAKANVALSSEQLAGFEIQTIEEDETTFRARLAARVAEIATSGGKLNGSGGLVQVKDIRLRDTKLRPPQRSSKTERLEAVATIVPDKP